MMIWASDDCLTADDAVIVADRLSALAEIARERSALSSRVAKAREAFDAEQKAADDALAALRTRCPHPLPEKKFHSDSSGGDSYTECLLCGAYL